MKGKIFNNKAVLRIDRGEMVADKIFEFVKEHNIKLASISGLGASDEIIVSVYNLDTKEYVENVYRGMFEITNLTGNVSTQGEKEYLHLHVTFADEENNAFGGHFVNAKISGTCELFIDIYDGEVDRIKDDITGLNIFKF